jgi:carboxymethylenebutenolidase
VPDLHIPAGAGSHQQAYLATPPLGTGPWPGVVVLQDAFGMTDDLREHTDRLATAGYVAVAPRLYTARGGGPRCVAAVFRAMTSGVGPVFDDIDAARG